MVDQASVGVDEEDVLHHIRSLRGDPHLSPFRCQHLLLVEVPQEGDVDIDWNLPRFLGLDLQLDGSPLPRGDPLDGLQSAGLQVAPKGDVHVTCRSLPHVLHEDAIAVPSALFKSFLRDFHGEFWLGLLDKFLDGLHEELLGRV